MSVPSRLDLLSLTSEQQTILRLSYKIGKSFSFIQEEFIRKFARRGDMLPIIHEVYKACPGSSETARRIVLIFLMARVCEASFLQIVPASAPETLVIWNIYCYLRKRLEETLEDDTRNLLLAEIFFCSLMIMPDAREVIYHGHVELERLSPCDILRMNKTIMWRAINNSSNPLPVSLEPIRPPLIFERTYYNVENLLDLSIPGVNEFEARILNFFNVYPDEQHQAERSIWDGTPAAPTPQTYFVADVSEPLRHDPSNILNAQPALFTEKPKDVLQLTKTLIDKIKRYETLSQDEIGEFKKILRSDSDDYMRELQEINMLSVNEIIGLLNFNFKIASSLLIALVSVEAERIQCIMEATTHVPFCVQLVDVVHRLYRALPHLPKALLVDFVCRICETVPGEGSTSVQARNVKLCSLFITSILKEGLVDVEDVNIAAEAFCLRFSTHPSSTALLQHIHS